jgi:IS30 family transposase
MKLRQIAKEIGLSPSTISRELHRNTGISGRYHRW